MSQSACLASQRALRVNGPSQRPEWIPLIDTASGPPTPSVLHVRNQGAHANIDDSENEDHDWPSDQTIEEDRQKEVQHTKYANIFIFTFLLQNTEYLHPN